MRILTTALLLGMPGFLWGQEAGGENAAARIPPPRAILLPWQNLGVESEAWSRLGEARRNGLNRLSAEILAGGKPLNTLIAAPSRNLERHLARMRGGTLKGARPYPVTVLPILCTVGDQLLAAMGAVTTGGAEMLRLRHRLIPLKELGDGAKVADALLAAWGEIQLPATAPQPTTNLKVGLRAGRQLGRADTGSARCLNLWAAEQLVEAGYRVIAPVGSEHQGALRRALPDLPAPARPTRIVQLYWSPPPKRSWPRSYGLRVGQAEGVFGQTLAPLGAGPLVLAVQGGKLRGELPAKLREALTVAQQELAMVDLPQVAHIYRGWAYVDKGRAWGLGMGDRLIAAGGAIKGHVVRYFGAEIGLTSPRGYLIQDGAIVYIRKSGPELQPGLAFSFDPTTFPTPWPPSGQ